VPAPPTPLALATAVDKATGDGLRRAREAVANGNRQAAVGHLERVLAHRQSLTEAFDLAADHQQIATTADHLAASAAALRTANATLAALLDGDLAAAAALLNQPGSGR